MLDAVPVRWNDANLLSKHTVVWDETQWACRLWRKCRLLPLLLIGVWWDQYDNFNSALICQSSLVTSKLDHRPKSELNAIVSRFICSMFDFAFKTLRKWIIFVFFSNNFTLWHFFQKFFFKQFYTWYFFLNCTLYTIFFFKKKIFWIQYLNRIIRIFSA